MEERRRQDVPPSAFRFWKDAAIYGMDSRAKVRSWHNNKADITYIETIDNEVKICHRCE
jgi:hypothetical protein